MGTEVKYNTLLGRIHCISGIKFRHGGNHLLQLIYRTHRSGTVRDSQSILVKVVNERQDAVNGKIRAVGSQGSEGCSINAQIVILDDKLVGIAVRSTNALPAAFFLCASKSLSLKEKSSI